MQQHCPEATNGFVVSVKTISIGFNCLNIQLGNITSQYIGDSPQWFLCIVRETTPQLDGLTDVPSSVRDEDGMRRQSTRNAGCSDGPAAWRGELPQLPTLQPKWRLQKYANMG